MKNTKIVSIILMLCILLGCCGCNAGAGQKGEISKSSEPEISIPVDPATQFEGTENDANPQTTSTPVAIPPVDEWEVTTVTNEIPITPEGYEGNLVTLVESYTSKDGVILEVTSLPIDLTPKRANLLRTLHLITAILSTGWTASSMLMNCLGSKSFKAVNL